MPVGHTALSKAEFYHGERKNETAEKRIEVQDIMKKRKRSRNHSLSNRMREELASIPDGPLFPVFTPLGEAKSIKATTSLEEDRVKQTKQEVGT